MKNSPFLSVADAIDAQLDAFLSTRKTKALTIENFFQSRVRIKEIGTGRIVPFVMKAPQSLHYQHKKESPVKKFLLLKSRRMGMTTQEQAESYKMCLTTPNASCVTLADNYINTATIFRMVRLMLRLDDKAPADAMEAKGHIEFPSLGSVFNIGTAGAKSFGRGDTINRAHGSEVAWWEADYDTIDNLVAGLTEAARYGETILETTANGARGWFYEKFCEAMRKENDWVPLFYPWFIDPQNSYDSSAEDRTEFIDTIEDEEKAVMELYDLTLNQAIWRRRKKFSLKKLFLQEYPETWEQAFLFRGTTFFEKDIIDSLSRTAAPPLRETDQAVIWKEPVPGHSYCAGADVGQGETSSNNSVCGIIDKETCEQVAVLRGKWRPEVFARKCIELCAKYNNATFACEVNNHGHSVMNTVVNVLKYKHLYYHHRTIEKNKFGQDKVEKRPGWLTNASTRPILLDELNHAMEEGLLKVNDRVFIQECKTFVDDGGGRFEASSNSQDDSIMSWGVAWQARKQLKKSYIIV